MCRQFYRHCRDCHELFPMPEPEMREPCDAFQKARAMKPHLKKCPRSEIPVIRPPSGHGGKVCETCSKRNRNEQRKRENAQKRARRAKLKRDKMTAGIGTGNVVWTPPNTWKASVGDAQTVATQPRRLNTFNMSSKTQALLYGQNGSISTATIAQNLVDVFQQEREGYSQSRQVGSATTSNVLHPQEDGQGRIGIEIRDDAKPHHQYAIPSPDLPTVMLENPCTEKQRQQVGLGITIPDDAKWEQSHTESSYFNEWSVRMELNEWSTVFEDDHDRDDAKDD